MKFFVSNKTKKIERSSGTEWCCPIVGTICKCQNGHDDHLFALIFFCCWLEAMATKFRARTIFHVGEDFCMFGVGVATDVRLVSIRAV